MKKSVRRTLVFLITISSLLYLLAAVSATDIDSCQTLSSSGTYTLNQSINSSSTCFQIDADDIIIDGAGFTINYSQSAAGYGVNNTAGHNNITIKNAIINQTGTTSISFGVYSQSGSNVIIDNNTIITRGANSEAILLNRDTDSMITNNNVTSFGGITISIDVTENITVTNNTLYSNGSIARGVSADTSNSTISYNNITSISLSGTSGGIFIGTSGSNNLVLSNIINITFGSSLTLSGTTTNNTFSSNTLLNDDLAQLSILSAGLNGTSITDQSILNYTLTGIGSLITIENSTYGKINFTESVNGSGNNLVGNSTSAIVFGNNSLKIDSSGNSGLNKGANVTLYGIGNRGYTTPGILKNGESCSDCYSFTSLTATNVIFNISGSGNYTIGETASDADTENTNSNDDSTYVPPYWQNTYVYDEQEFSTMEELAINLSAKQRVRLKINNETHYVGVISLTQNNATINISSTPQQKTFEKDEENIFDVDEDGYADISVRLNEITNSKTNLLLTPIHEEIEITSEETNNSTANNSESGEEANVPTENKSNKWIIWLIIILLIIAIVAFLYLRWKKDQDN